MHFVTIFSLDDGCVEELVGPFESAGDAMTWADDRSLQMTRENPNYSRESSDEIILVSAGEGDTISGYVIQVIMPDSPDEEDPEPVPVNVPFHEENI